MSPRKVTQVSLYSFTIIAPYFVEAIKEYAHAASREHPIYKWSCAAYVGLSEFGNDKITKTVPGEIALM